MAAVTLGKDLTKDKLVQACMRMRLLGNGHMVKFYAPNEIDNKIRELTNKDSSAEINSIDVLEWSIKNSLNQIESGFLYWAIQGLSFAKKTYSNLEFETNLDKQSYFINCKEDYSNELKTIYGKSRQDLFIKDLILNHKKTTKDILMKKSNNNSNNIDLFEKESSKIYEKDLQISNPYFSFNYFSIKLRSITAIS